MNVAALLQDSPSDDRRRASSNASQQPPQTQQQQTQPANDGPPTPQPQPPPSPQWPRASAGSSRTQTWPPPPFIRPASAHSDSAPPKDPAWSPVSGHTSPKPYYSLLDNRTIPPPASTTLLQRSRAGSQSSPHAHTPSPAAAGPYAKPPSSASSPSTPFHPHPHPSSPRQPRLPASTGSPRVHPSLSSSNVSSFPPPLAHISPAAPSTRPGPVEPLLGVEGTRGLPPGGAWGNPNDVTSHVIGSNNLNLMERHNIPTGPALAGTVPPTSSLNSTTSSLVSARLAATQLPSPMDGLRDVRERERDPRDREWERERERDWESLRERDRERIQTKDMSALRDPGRERADSFGQRERERERAIEDRRRRPSNAASSALVGPGTGGSPPYLLSNDNKPPHPHMDSARPSLSPSISSRPQQHHSSLSASNTSNINASMSSSTSVRMHTPPPVSRRPSGASRDADPDNVIPRERDPRDVRDPRDLRDMRDPRDMGLRDSRDMRDPRDVAVRDSRDIRERDRELRLREMEMRAGPERDAGLRDRERERDREIRERDSREREMRDRELRDRDLRDRELRERDFFKEREAREYSRDRGAPPPPAPMSASLSTSAAGPPPPSYLPPPGSAVANSRDREQQQRDRERDIHREREREQRDRADMDQIRAAANLRQQQISGLPGQQQMSSQQQSSQQQQQSIQQQMQLQRERERESRPPIGPGVIPSGPPPLPSSISGGGPSGAHAPMASGERRQGTPESVMLKHVQYERERDRERADKERERMDRDRERDRADRERADRERIDIDRMERDRERMERERMERDRKERQWVERDKEKEHDRDRERALGSGPRPAASGAYPPPSSSSTGGPGGSGLAPPRDRRDREREQPLANPHPFIHPQGHLHQHQHSSSQSQSQSQHAQGHHQQPPPHPSHPSHSHIHPSHAHAHEPRAHTQSQSRQASSAPPLTSSASGAAASSLSPPSGAQHSISGISVPPPSASSSNANPSANPNATSAPGAGPPPQKLFQTQFHTQFVSGLHQQRMDPSGAGPMGGVIIGGERERGREGDRDGRDRAGSRLGSPVPFSMGVAVGPGLGMGMSGDKRDRDRERGMERDGKRSGRNSVLGKDERERDRERLRDRDREIGREKGREMYAQALKPGGERERDKDREPERSRDRDRRADEGYSEPGMGYPPHPMQQGQRMSTSAQMHLEQQQKQQLGYHPQHQTRLSSSQHPGQPLHPDSMMVDDHPPPPPPQMSHPGLYPMHGTSHTYGLNPTVSPDFGPHAHQLRERERDRRDRERERDDRDVDMDDVAVHEAQMQMQNQQWHMMQHAQQQQHVRGPSGGGGHGTIGLGMSEEVWYDAGGPLTIGHGPGADYPVLRRDRDRERDREREREREYQDAQRGHSHPHPHTHLHPHQQQQLQMQQQQQGLPPHLQPQALGPPGMHSQVPPPLQSADSELMLQDEDEYLADEWEEWRADADGESKRARVRVDLGTWVYPKLPFPYFFELGDGLVGVKEREEEKERREKEKLERERKETERLEKERAEKERKEMEQKEREEREKKEKEEREQEKARVEKERKEKEELEAKAAEAARASQSMEEGEIDEEEEKTKGAQWEAEKQVQKLEEEERPNEQEKIAEKETQEKAPSETLEEKVKEPPAVISPSPSAPVVAAASTLLDDPLPEPQQPPLDFETRTTILIPNGFIPTEKPLRPRIWGGGGFDPNPHPRPPLPVRSRSGRKGKVGASANGKRTRPPLSAKASNSTLGASANGTDLNGASSSTPLNGKPRQQSMRSRRTRRIYTDDSDVFQCAVHSGWLTWSGARKARTRGRDLRIEVRVLRCAGTGAGSLFARGAGVAGATRAPGDPELVREEIVGRFVGGYGERCFNPLGQTGRVAGEEGEDGFGAADGLSIDGGMDGELLYDDPEDDGRCLVSAAWGTGHDGSAIEIVGVEFVERGTAHKAPGVGRRNRAQRLLEYAERRASVLGHQVGCNPLTRTLAGRKRRRGWDGWPVQPRRLPNAAVLDVILEEPDEAEEDEDEGRPKKKTKVQEAEEKLMETRTVVLGIGANVDLRVGYKYVSSMLKDILFPSARSPDVDAAPSRKRRHVQEIEDIEMADADTPMITGTASPIKTQRVPTDLVRPVILETPKESYLFSPCVPAASDGPVELPIERTYELALILEAETEVLEEDPAGIEGGDKPLEQVEKSADDLEPSGPDTGKHDQSASEPLPASGEENTSTSTDAATSSSLPKTPDESPIEAADKSTALSISMSAVTPIATSRATTPLPRSISPSRASPVHSPEPEIKDPPTSSPSYAYRRHSLSTEDDVEADKVATLPVQVLQRNMTENMFRFTDDGVYVLDGSASDGMETEWVIQVKNWKWAPAHKSAREKL